jgi:hypothetical protein
MTRQRLQSEVDFIRTGGQGKQQRQRQQEARHHDLSGLRRLQ